MYSNIFDEIANVKIDEKNFNPSPDLEASEDQQKAITSCDCPAVLLHAGPGTGKSFVLVQRIVHLIQSKKCRPEELIVLSYTNRDADTLKVRAVQVLQGNAAAVSPDQIWSGTLHSFASNILRTSSSKVRTLHDGQVTKQIDQSLRLLLNERYYNNRRQKLQTVRLIHRDALAEMRQSRDMVIHQVSRCIGIWKEAGLLPPPKINGIIREDAKLTQQLRDNCLEISSRLGIVQNVARLAWELYPITQVCCLLPCMR